jgi:hypothetical protein
LASALTTPFAAAGKPSVSLSRLNYQADNKRTLSSANPTGIFAFGTKVNISVPNANVPRERVFQVTVTRVWHINGMFPPVIAISDRQVVAPHFSGAAQAFVVDDYYATNQPDIGSFKIEVTVIEVANDGPDWGDGPDNRGYSSLTSALAAAFPPTNFGEKMY